MELAVRSGFDVQVLTLPDGTDPADLADGFEARLADAEHFLTYGVRILVARGPDRPSAFTIGNLRFAQRSHRAAEQ